MHTFILCTVLLSELVPVTFAAPARKPDADPLHQGSEHFLQPSKAGQHHSRPIHPNFIIAVLNASQPTGASNATLAEELTPMKAVRSGSGSGYHEHPDITWIPTMMDIGMFPLNVGYTPRVDIAAGGNGGGGGGGGNDNGNMAAAIATYLAKQDTGGGGSGSG